MDEDDLLTPYKEVSFEVYERRDLDSSSWTTDSDSYISYDEEEDVVLRRIHQEAITAREEEHPDEEIPKRKRGRPRKPAPPTPDPAEVAGGQDLHAADGCQGEANGNIDLTTPDESAPTPIVKKRGRPRKGEQSNKSRMELVQTLECIIPEGTKRQSRPSRFLDDYDSCLPRSVASSSTSSDGEYVKRARGRPRTKPPRERVFLPDGTPRGRGRPRTKHLSDPRSDMLGESFMSANSTLNDSVQSEGMPGINCERMEQGNATFPMSGGSMNGNAGNNRNKRPRGRPRKYPYKDKNQKYTKRIAQPGKKLGRPRKDDEKQHHKFVATAKKVPDQTWHIKWNGIFKYVTGGKSPICKTEIIGKVNGVGKVKKTKVERLMVKKEETIKTENDEEEPKANETEKENISKNKLEDQESLLGSSKMPDASNNLLRTDEDMESSTDSEASFSSYKSGISTSNSGCLSQSKQGIKVRNDLHENNLKPMPTNEGGPSKRIKLDIQESKPDNVASKEDVEMIDADEELTEKIENFESKHVNIDTSTSEKDKEPPPQTFEKFSHDDTPMHETPARQEKSFNNKQDSRTQGGPSKRLKLDILESKPDNVASKEDVEMIDADEEPTEKVENFESKHVNIESPTSEKDKEQPPQTSEEFSHDDTPMHETPASQENSFNNKQDSTKTNGIDATQAESNTDPLRNDVKSNSILTIDDARNDEDHAESDLKDLDKVQS